MLKYRIEPVKGYSKQIGILISEMQHTRKITLDLTSSLSQKELDYNIDDESNSIGTLLLHIAALEFDYQIRHFYKRDYTECELERYKYALPGRMIYRKIAGNNYDYYLNELKNIRRQTLTELKELNDEWLFDSVIIYKNYDFNNYYLLKHLQDDELNHQGQIKWILKKLK